MGNILLKPLARDTLTIQAADTIRRFILLEELEPGYQLPSERELSGILSVSRNIVREALTILVTEGLIIKKPGRGIFVADFDRSKLSMVAEGSLNYENNDLQTLSEARSAIEIGSANLMVERITPEQIAELKQINQILAENLRSGRNANKEDVAFHTVLFQSTQNQIIIDLLPLLEEMFRLLVISDPKVMAHNPERIIFEHQSIIDGLEQRDVDTVRKALTTHLYPYANVKKEKEVIYA